jgi:hypothetical protein
VDVDTHFRVSRGRTPTREAAIAAFAKSWRRVPKVAAQIVQRFPQQVQEIAMRYGVDIATAAIILAQILSGAPMPEAAMAEGGPAKRHQPIVVGRAAP